MFDRNGYLFYYFVCFFAASRSPHLLGGRHVGHAQHAQGLALHDPTTPQQQCQQQKQQQCDTRRPAGEVPRRDHTLLR